MFNGIIYNTGKVKSIEKQKIVYVWYSIKFKFNQKI